MTQKLERYKEYRHKIFSKAYSFLNDKQKEAVFTTEKPLLILAGAGSGKTTVLVQRIAFIIKYGNAYFNDNIPPEVLTDENLEALRYIAESPEATKEDLNEAMDCFAVNPASPWQILSITFTNKAANEMKERLQNILGDTALDIWAGTFHSICVRILRRYIDRLGYDKSFTIYDTDDQKRLMNSIIKEKNLDDKQFPAKSVLGEISRSKDKLISYVAYATNAGSDFRKQIIAQLFEAYEQRKAQANALDFDDIIFFTVKLLAENEDIKNEYRQRFRYILVDEYQDTNISQFNLVKLLCAEHNNIMVVGDDDQSIYKFRGATIENILSFDKSFDDATVIKLEQNYRSSANIIAAANAIIKNNSDRKGKELWTNLEEGEKILIKECEQNTDEAEFIVRKIKELIEKRGYKHSDFAVLYRMNSLSATLETSFAKSGLPYRILGGMRFYDRMEIKDIISYLCVVNNPADNLRLKRIINTPKRGIGDTTVDEVERVAMSEGISMLEVLSRAQDFPALGRSAVKLKAFYDMIADFRKTAENETLPVLFEKIIEKSGYMQMLVDSGESEADRIDNLKELVSNAVRYEADNEEATLSGFLEEVALVSDIDNYDPDSPAVVLMTIHSAKGLEFPVVFLPGFEETIFPSAQSSFETAELEEERRLAYVAVTRAKRELVISYCGRRLIYGRTVCNPRSRFVDEIPENICDLQNAFSVDRFANLAHRYGGGNGTQYSGSGMRSDTYLNPEYGKVQRKLGSPYLQKSSYQKPSTQQAPSIKTYGPGARVSHAKFGNGIVLSAKPMGADIMYEIAFDDFGTKKLMATYAKLKDCEE